MRRIEPVSSLDLRLEARPWAFAEHERPRIDAHWRTLAAANPRLWNGEVLICTEAAVVAGTLSARFAVTDYASFVAWRDWGWPDRSVRNCFGTPAILTADGALVYGVMGRHTSNAGLVYPPSGSLEPRDVTPGGGIDLEGSIAHELAEETGLDVAAAEAGPWLAVFEGQRLAIARTLRFDLSLAAIAERFAAHAGAQETPELSSLLAIRSTSQIDSRMPGFAQDIVRFFFPREEVP